MQRNHELDHRQCLHREEGLVSSWPPVSVRLGDVGDLSWALTLTPPGYCDPVIGESTSLLSAFLLASAYS